MSITENRKARHDYDLEEEYTAGLSLQGWEVKSLRANKVSIKESYVVIRNGEAWLLGAHISPLLSASTHVQPDPTRTRKLLLHRKEIQQLIGKVEQKGYTLVPLQLFWSKGRAKLSFFLARGRKQHDKRHAIKEREWTREKERLRRWSN